MKDRSRTKIRQPGKITLPRICACIFFGCFFLGVFSANLWLEEEALWTGFVNENNLLQFTRENQEISAFFQFAWRERLIPWMILIVSGYFSLGRIVCSIWTGWLGVSGGFLFAALLQRHGAKGILWMGGLEFPQILIYAAAYAVWIQFVWIFFREKQENYVLLRSELSKRKQKGMYLIFAVLISGVYVLGILAEYYVNPFLLEGLR